MAENQAKQSQKERLKEITDSIETGIKDMFESDKYRTYLQTMSRFHKYSLNNTMLIAMQKPDATLVAGFNKWKDGFGRNVKKGEKGIKIIAPVPYKVKEERTKLDPVTKAPLLDKDGKLQTEEVEKQIPTFRVVSVFDVSQTEGKEIPTLVNDLMGNVENYEIFMEALNRSSIVPIEIKPIANGADGYYHLEDKTIAIREGMSEIQTISATIHEMAHSKLHDKAVLDENGEPVKKDRNTEEVEAESISYAVCNYYGIETSDNSFGYIANWSKGKGLKELKSSLELIGKTSSELITDIDKHLAEITKEREAELTQEVQQPVVLSEVDILAAKIDSFVAEYDPHSYRDNLNDAENSIDEIKNNLATGKLFEIREYLKDVVEENGEFSEQAQELIESVDKYEFDNYPKEVAYSFEDKFLSIHECEEGYDYSIYNSNYEEIDGGVYDDPNLTIYEAIQEAFILEELKFPITANEGVLEVDFTELTEKADNVAMSKVVGTIKYSDASAFNFDNSDPNFVDSDLPLFTNVDGDKFAFGFGSFGNGQTVWNYLDEENGDYKQVAHIDNSGNIKIYDDTLPQTAIKHLENHAEKMNPPVENTHSIATTNDFHPDDRPIVDLTDIKRELELPYDFERNMFLQNYLDTVCLKYDVTETEVSDFIIYGVSDNYFEIWDLDKISKSDFAEAVSQGSYSMIADKVVRSHEVDETQKPYFMPDPNITFAHTAEYGYTSEELLPLTKERAFDLYNEDLAIYALYPDNTETMIFDITEIDSHAGYFGIEKADWENFYEFKELQILENNLTPLEEKEFLENTSDSFAIFQIKDGAEFRDYRYASVREIEATGKAIDRDNYNLVYTSELQNVSSVNHALNALYQDFNCDRPSDFTGHSMSVSDIVAIKLNGVVSCHYVDSFGFKEVDNYLKTAELSTEQNFNQIDGVINNEPTVADLEQDVKDGKTISLMDLANAVNREQKEKKSVLAELKSTPPSEHKEKTTKNKEMER